MQLRGISCSEQNVGWTMCLQQRSSNDGGGSCSAVPGMCLGGVCLHGSRTATKFVFWDLQ